MHQSIKLLYKSYIIESNKLDPATQDINLFNYRGEL